jgi:hypothetical protein
MTDDESNSPIHESRGLRCSLCNKSVSGLRGGVCPKCSEKPAPDLQRDLSESDETPLHKEHGKTAINVFFVFGVIVILFLATCVSMLHGCWGSSGGITGTGFM